MKRYGVMGQRLLPPVARPRYPPRRAARRGQERLGGDDVRPRPRDGRGTDADPAGPFGKGLATAQGGRHRRPHGRRSNSRPAISGSEPATGSSPDPTRSPTAFSASAWRSSKRRLDGTKFRLIGIGVSDLGDGERADPPDLVDPQATKRAIAEGAVDKLRSKFGDKAVETGYTFGQGRPDRPQRDG